MEFCEYSVVRPCRPDFDLSTIAVIERKYVFTRNVKMHKFG